MLPPTRILLWEFPMPFALSPSPPLRYTFPTPFRAKISATKVLSHRMRREPLLVLDYKDIPWHWNISGTSLLFYPVLPHNLFIHLLDFFPGISRKNINHPGNKNQV